MSSLTVYVREAGSGTILRDFRFLVNLDNVGDPQSPYQADWPSLRSTASHSPVVATGDALSPTVTLPAGRYLVSVLAPGHKLGGAHVQVVGQARVMVELRPDPLPLSRIYVHVFHDNHPLNGEDDIPVEKGLAGFHVVVSDAVGEVTVDYFGNVLGTQYERDSSGNPVLGPDGRPIPIPGTGGKILTDANGDAWIENLPPGKYGIQAIPPDGSDWVQTTTIEGTKVIDAWIEEGNSGYLTEEGFQSPLVWIGFARPTAWGDVKPPGSGRILGTVRTIVDFAPPNQPLALGSPVDRPWIALTDLSSNDELVYLGRGDSNGRFTIDRVPTGTYQMAIFDEPLDYIISFWTVIVGEGAAIDLGDLGLPRWFGWLKGTVFRDENENGRLDTGEQGIPDVEVTTRFKDGSVQYSTVSGMDGAYELSEVFDLGYFTVAEVGFTRFGRTGATAQPNVGHPFQPETTYPGALMLATLTGAGQTNRIDWGRKEYPLAGPDRTPGTGDDTTNGGISGIVYYATMRNELDPVRAVGEAYEPGIPNVTINLYHKNGDALELLATAATDAWQRPQNCVRPDGTIDPDCLEIPANSGQVREGVFDGGYAFGPLAPGAYVVEVVPPQGYRAIDEQSINTGEGDEFRIAMAPPPYERGSRTRKVVVLREGQNAICDFFLYTDVPIPGRILGWLFDDLNLESNPASPFFGEKRGIPNTPIGIRDFTGRLLKTVLTDNNGAFEVLLPSTRTTNVPLPSGVSPGMYRVVGNDPGDPGAPNPNYNPDYQTLPLVFDVWPGKTTYADVAVFPITAFVGLQGLPFASPPQCAPDPVTPQIYEVDRVVLAPTSSRVMTISGTGFGTTPGQVTLGGQALPLGAWTDTAITAAVPTGFAPGPWQLQVRTADGRESRVGLTIHVLGPEYSPPVRTIPPGRTIQETIDAAPENALVLVPPGRYYESPILYKNVKLQGQGAHETIVDGRFFKSYEAAWRAKLASLAYDGPPLTSGGQAVTVVAREGAFRPDYRPQIDGFTITGARGQEGGGILVHAHGSFLEISNNVIVQNGGGFGGGITLGKAYRGDNHNYSIRIHHNLIAHNGGISLAGGIGIFNGANNYEIDHNDVCGNYSAEYGGGISHFGLSPGGRIHDNRILFNASFDEGSGVLLGGEQPLPPQQLSAGAGEVDFYNNLVQGNVSNDDGGGFRLLKFGAWPCRVWNNLIVNNVAADLGGGIALDDASNVAIFNNTVAKNASTATAEDSDGNPHGAGLVSEANSAPFQASLPPGSPQFSDPVLFDNLFWDNRAYHFDLAQNRLADDYQVIDDEVFGTLTPAHVTHHYSYLSRPSPSAAGQGNLIFDGTNPPGFVAEYTTQLSAQAFQGQPGFKTVKIITVTPALEGDYHLTAASPAIDAGTAELTVGGVTYRAPADDFDHRPRPQGAGYDLGACEVQLQPMEKR